MLRVSVIVCTYNHEKYISKCLESITTQKCDFEYEILVGDDNSTDKTISIIRKYSDKFSNIRVYRRSHNIGATKNAYELIKNSRGEYLAFCEGDDFWTDCNKLKTQVDFLDEHKEYIGCSNKSIIVDKNGTPRSWQGLTWVLNKRRFTIKDFRGIYLPGQTASIVKRNIFIGTDIDYSFIYKMNSNISDRTSTLVYLLKGDFYIFDKVMSAYRIADEGTNLTSLCYSGNYVKNELEYTEKLEKYALQNGAPRTMFYLYYSELSFLAAKECIKNYDKEKIKILFKALKHVYGGSLLGVPIIIGCLKRYIDRHRRIK